MFKNQTLIFGGSIFLALIGLGFYFFLRPKKEVKALKDSEKKEIVKNSFAASQEEVEEVADEVESPVKSSNPVVVDDEGDSEDDDGEAALKTAYDDALRMAKKLLNGNKFDRAAEKYSDAISLADRIPSGGKDIVTLYNNRR